MWKSRDEIVKTYLDHLESVELSGLGHEGSAVEILSLMTEATRLWDEGERSPNFQMLHG